MSNETINKLIPALRFPEFVNEGEWDDKTVGEIALSESSSMALNKLELKSKGYAVYGADSIVGYIDTFQQDEKYISVVKDGSGVGRLNLCKSHSSILGTLVCLKSKNQKLYQLEWIYYLLNTIDFSVYIKGAGIPHIYYSDFRDEKILVPKPPEQQKIASCLSSLDEVIVAHSQKLDVLKEHKKGLMQNLFPQEGERVPKWRFKEFEGDGEWVEKPLGEICSSISSGKDRIVENGEYDLYGSTGIIGRTNNYSYDGQFILAARVGANAGLLTRTKGRFGVTDNTLVIYLYHIEIIDFIYYTLERAGLNRLVFGSGQPLITGGQLKSLNINLPCTKEQQKIASCLSSLDDLITAQAEKVEQLKLHKMGLMQGLFVV